MSIRLVAELEAAQRKEASLDRPRLAPCERHNAACCFFEAQPPGCRRTMACWVRRAKQEATRKKRLRRLIDESGAGRRVT